MKLNASFHQILVQVLAEFEHFGKQFLRLLVFDAVNFHTYAEVVTGLFPLTHKLVQMLFLRLLLRVSEAEVHLDCASLARSEVIHVGQVRFVLTAFCNFFLAINWR